MKTSSCIQFGLLIAAVVIVSGCSGDQTNGPVSGKVTLDGIPLAGIEVVFSPMATEGNSNPGVYSFSMTDDQGHYELKTRYGDRGAMIGKHMVTIQYPDHDDLLETQEELMDALQDAKDADEEDGAAVVAEVKARLAKIKKGKTVDRGSPLPHTRNSLCQRAASNPAILFWSATRPKRNEEKSVLRPSMCCDPRWRTHFPISRCVVSFGDVSQSA